MNYHDPTHRPGHLRFPRHRRGHAQRLVAHGHAVIVNYAGNTRRSRSRGARDRSRFRARSASSTALAWAITVYSPACDVSKRWNNRQ